MIHTDVQILGMSVQSGMTVTASLLDQGLRDVSVYIQCPAGIIETANLSWRELPWFLSSVPHRTKVKQSTSDREIAVAADRPVGHYRILLARYVRKYRCRILLGKAIRYDI